jgi:2-polyprenyl-6-methoxyphenol hydroxylase-like FAD-dependent oxidoreductase
VGADRPLRWRHADFGAVTTGQRPQGLVHIVGAGPVGLFLAALLQSVEGQHVRLYEHREAYTRTRMVSLAPYLVADSIESYGADVMDGQDVNAIFDPDELETRLAYRRTVAPDLREHLEAWTRGFVPLNAIETSLSELIETRRTGTVERVTARLDAETALANLRPGDVLVDASGAKSLLRDLLLPGDDLDQPDRNTRRYLLEHALVITFLYSRHYDCDEWCKHYKNAGNTTYKFIPGVRRTWYDGDVTFVTGFVVITPDDFARIPRSTDGAWLREHEPDIARSMDRFIDAMRATTHGEVVGDLEVTRIPLEVYGARNATSRRWHASGLDHPLASAPVFLVGDAASGSPYFQAVSLGFENAFFLAGHLANRSLPMAAIFDRYETFMHQQWLRVYMRTQMIKHNKDLLESVGDVDALLAKLHVF